MRERPIIKFCPGLELLEVKRPLSVSASAAPFVNLKAGSGSLARAQPRHRVLPGPSAPSRAIEPPRAGTAAHRSMQTSRFPLGP